jgi:hypothetical protein
MNSAALPRTSAISNGERVPQKAGKAAFDGGAVCGVHSNPGH